jgi:hypothetical protein
MNKILSDLFGEDYEQIKKQKVSINSSNLFFAQLNIGREENQSFLGFLDRLKLPYYKIVACFNDLDQIADD